MHIFHDNPFSIFCQTPSLQRYLTKQTINQVFTVHEHDHLLVKVSLETFQCFRYNVYTYKIKRRDRLVLIRECICELLNLIWKINASIKFILHLVINHTFIYYKFSLEIGNRLQLHSPKLCTSSSSSSSSVNHLIYI